MNILPTLRWLGMAVLMACLLTGCSKSESGVASDADTGAADATSTSEAPKTDPVGQTNPFPGAGEPAPAAVDPATVVATVNGIELTEGEVERLFENFVKEQTGGRPVPPQQLVQARVQLRPQILDSLISQTLLDQKVKEKAIAVTEEELSSEIERGLAIEMLREEASKEEFAEMVKSNTGKTYEEYVTDLATNPDFKRYYSGIKLLEVMYPEVSAISDEELVERYERDKDKNFTTETQVKASHILFGTTEPDADKDALRAKADATLTAVKAPDADFAELAKEHSSCPSSAKGGDLGFFPRKGAMVEEFAKAAYDLKVGDVSDIVETQFGYHIIKVTERKDGKTRTLEEVKPILAEQLTLEKRAAKQEELLKEMREAATIEKS